MGRANKTRWWILTALLVAFPSIAVSPARAATTMPNGFSLDEITTGLNQPVAFGFTPSGQMFVAEKGGTVHVFDSVEDPTPALVIDVRADVNDYWDRGLLGFAVDPDFGSGSDYLYLLYAYDQGNSWGDDCADPTGAGCTINGRLSRFGIAGDGTAGPEQVILVGNWCAQYPSHTVGDLVFTDDGHLLVSAGDGASFNFADYGQNGNPCGDPMGVSGRADNLGGALRSQRPAASEAVTYDGTVLRIDKATGASIGGNPAGTDTRIIAQGLRNPFRMTVRPGTSEVWVGDVGWDTWEEVNRIVDPGGSRENFGWPCYEGANSAASPKQGTYDSLDLDLCEALYAEGQAAVVAPYYARPHEPANTRPGCPGTGGSISGLAFYEGGDYPAQFDGALFIADYSIGCIRVMFPSTEFGLPQKDDILTFVGGADQNTAPAAVDLQIGPEGDLYYADIATGKIVRVAYENAGPTAVATAQPTRGSIPFVVQFNGAGSTDPEGDELSYAWDLDGDGAYDDSILAEPSWTYTSPGEVRVGLEVTDAFGNSARHSIGIDPVANQAPTAIMDAPGSSRTWAVGDTISFSGRATDPVDGALPASALRWDVIMNHCAEVGSCHTHVIQTITGMTAGSFTAPDHPYPSYLSIRLTATDAGGLTDRVTVDLQPRTTIVTIASSPGPVSVEAGVEGLSSYASPATITVIEGGSLTINAPSPQSIDGRLYNFTAWSDGQPQFHTVSVGGAGMTITAAYVAAPTGGGSVGGSSGGVAPTGGGGTAPTGGGGVGASTGGVAPPGGAGATPSTRTFADVPETHPFYPYIEWMAAQQITLGCAEGRFCPDASVTRAQMASFLVRAFALPGAESDQFTDISGSIHRGDINSLVARRITLGCAADRFCPLDAVTRAQMASFLVRSLLLLPAADMFADDAGSIHEQDINSLAASGVTLGCGPNAYCPNAFVARAEMAAFLFRSFNPEG